MKSQDGIDIGYMHAALRLADRGWGCVHPNPLVGAVVVRDRVVIGEGYHREYGRAHAEVEALQAAGEAARGCTLYVTLEPCTHYGQTPPCTDAIISAGIARVVYGAADPNPKARGGAAVLREAGIEVKGGVEEDYVRVQNALFFKRHERGGSFLALKLAMSLDARLTSALNARERVTDEPADVEVHRLRAGFDVIMIGANTARTDDPTLTVRYDKHGIRPPVRVVLDTNAALSVDSALVRSREEAPLLVICGETANATALVGAGVQVITVPTVDGRVDLGEALRQLEAGGLYSVFCEGGATLGAALLEEDLVDRVYAFVAPKFFGPVGVPAFPLKNSLQSPRFKLQRIAQHGADALLMLDRCSPD